MQAYRRIVPLPEPPRIAEYDVLMLGLSGAGKSTMLLQLKGEDLSNVQPTKGFMIKPLEFQRITLHVKEIGGSFGNTL